MKDGRVPCIAVEPPFPSQFSHEILNANPYAYLDDAPLEERRARAVEMRRILPESILEEVGKLDPAAIEQVREEAWPDVRDADELHDVLHTLIAFPAAYLNSAGVGMGVDSGHVGTGALARPVEQSSTIWQPLFEQLGGQNRAIVGRTGNREYWIATERAETFTLLFPNAKFDTAPAEIARKVPSKDDALLALVTGWMGHLG